MAVARARVIFARNLERMRASVEETVKLMGAEGGLVWKELGRGDGGKGESRASNERRAG